MASLTHVCMWSDNQWRAITAEEAVKLHPGGPVSAHSGLFMCELCGQYVSLTTGEVKKRHFRHSAEEKDKACPERTFGANYSISFNDWDHDLPIRIIPMSSSAFRFEIGLVRAPVSLLKADFRIEIRPKEASDVCFIFSKERIDFDSITYLPIGEQPSEKYTLTFHNSDDALHDFWPAEIIGVDPRGTLFAKASGIKLPPDADVEIEREYYLLKRGNVPPHACPYMRIQKVAQKRVSFDVWTLYVVSASAFNEDTARFYLDFHCRLTDHPVSLQPVWPLFVEGKYLIKHNQNCLYMLVDGNASSVKTFPLAKNHWIFNDSSQSKLYKIQCADRQQLISAGRAQVLQYAYFWKEPLLQEGILPEVPVTDLSGAVVAPGEVSTLPPSKTLCFKVPFDGELVVSKSQRIIERRKLPAGQCAEFDEISFGLTIQVIVGLDIVWQIYFKKSQSAITEEESRLLEQIEKASGALIPVPHALRNILTGMKGYPKICHWIRCCLRNGTIHEQSYRILQNTYLKLSTNR